MRALKIASAVELISLVVLFLNLATVHWPAVSSAVGPTHGCAYLLVIILAFQQPRATKALALVPGIGGLLVVRRLVSTENAAPRTDP